MSKPIPGPADAGHWDDHATWWQDHFTEGVDPEYEEQILPLAVALVEGARRVLEVGTGEGQVARRLRAAGVPVVVGVDPTATQIVEARRRGGGVLAVRAGAEALPVADGAVDAVVICLVLEHVDDLDVVLDEVVRVLEPGGRFVLFLNHPLLQTPDSGWIDDHMVDPPEQYWRIGPYLREAATVERVAPGVDIRFVHRPLSRYLNGLARRGMVLERFLEPSPPPGFLALAPGYQDAAQVPRLCAIVTRRA
jgi:SAM-dependent methyltransferase